MKIVHGNCVFVCVCVWADGEEAADQKTLQHLAVTLKDLADKYSGKQHLVAKYSSFLKEIEELVNKQRNIVNVRQKLKQRLCELQEIQTELRELEHTTTAHSKRLEIQLATGINQSTSEQ